jgi:hypothetical protein
MISSSFSSLVLEKTFTNSRTSRRAKDEDEGLPLVSTVCKTLGGVARKSNTPKFAAIVPRPLRKLKSLGFGAVLITLAVCGCATKSVRKPGGDEVSTAVPAPQPSQPQAKRPFLVSAFSWLPKFSLRRPKAPQAQVPRLIGVIKMVDEDDRFVLIDATTFQGAAAGDLLICIRDQKETANLRMSNLQNPPFLIADVASGKPAPGDRVVKP